MPKPRGRSSRMSESKRRCPVRSPRVVRGRIRTSRRATQGGKVRRVLGCLTACAAGLLVVSAPGSSADVTPLRYVALGDSYSAASGNLPPDPSAQPECARSLVNFPNVIANRTTPTRFKDVSCGGADTSDYFSSQYDGVPPQLDAVRPKTTLVTMTIGGNNNNTFIDAIVKCGTEGVSTGGQGSPCKDKYGSSFADD